ncbi:MAG TPA: 50S ribosomal protein L20 [bacterium (Candidatus Stahlbacteria)]|nr:50S ribosomal protein L20 [Candidatus Stahlbacteria bacterium]
MARIKSSVTSRRRHKKWLYRARGYYGGRHRLYRTARVAVMRSLAYAYRDRRKKKRAFRSLWITRIGIALKKYGLSYSTFIGGLRKARVFIDRKVLAEIAFSDLEKLKALVMIAKGSSDAR